MKVRDWVFSIILVFVMFVFAQAFMSRCHHHSGGGFLGWLVRVASVVFLADAYYYDYRDEQPPEEVQEAFMAMASQEPIVRQVGSDGNPQLNFSQGW